MKEEYAKFNPAEGVERVLNASEGYYTWTEQDVLAFERCHPIGTKSRLAMALLLWLGVRRLDVVLLGPSHVVDGLISFVQFKGRKKSQRIITSPSCRLCKMFWRTRPSAKKRILRLLSGNLSPQRALVIGSAVNATRRAFHNALRMA